MRRQQLNKGPKAKSIRLIDEPVDDTTLHHKVDGIVAFISKSIYVKK